MGLDMYINSVNKTKHSIKTLLKINEDAKPDSPKAAPFLPLKEYDYFAGHFSIFHEVAYWRKFNALHGWFVKNIQGGVDDCGYYELTKENLQSCLANLKETLISQDSGKLEPVEGFFFGSNETNEWYWTDIEKAVSTISALIETDFEKKRLFYHSSW